MADFVSKLFAFKKLFRDYRLASTRWLVNTIAKPTPKFQSVNLDYLRIGAFYFMRYDLQKINKTTKMEQFAPVLLVDYKPLIDSKIIYVLNLNFLTTQKKEAFFSDFLTSHTATLEANAKKKEWLTEQPLTGINYDSMFAALLRYGFDYAVREYRVELINDIYGISTDDIEKLITINTQAITGVDEAKINDIWIAKLKKETLASRIEDVIAIKNNYQKIIDELAIKFKHLNKRLDQ